MANSSTPSTTRTTGEHEGPAELLARLIRFDTTNPPGHERECITFIEQLLGDAGLETTIRACDDERPNLIARLPGRGQAPPLLLYGHVDVVPAEAADWSQPPFEGSIEDDYVWGRGALDMKGGLAMMICALLRARQEEASPAGDVLFAALSDEEAGAQVGARYLVDEHPELFDGVRYAIGEFGGFTLHVAGRRLYPIQVAEKQTCQVRATVRGPAGHASMPSPGGATAKLAHLLDRLDDQPLPLHLTPVVQHTLEEIAGGLPGPAGDVARQAVKAAARLPSPADAALRRLLGTGVGDRLIGDLLEPQLRNTAVPTIVHAGEKRNVIPGEATVDIDGRLLPGQTPDDFLSELAGVLGEEVELEVVKFDAAPSEVDYGLFGLLAGILSELDPGATPVPMLLPAVTDGRHLARLGIQSYGFLPLRLDSSFNFLETIHGADERVPVQALEFGVRAFGELIARYGG